METKIKEILSCNGCLHFTDDADWPGYCHVEVGKEPKRVDIGPNEGRFPDWCPFPEKQKFFSRMSTEKANKKIGLKFDAILNSQKKLKDLIAETEQIRNYFGIKPESKVFRSAKKFLEYLEDYDSGEF